MHIKAMNTYSLASAKAIKDFSCLFGLLVVIIGLACIRLLLLRSDQ